MPAGRAPNLVSPYRARISPSPDDGRRPHSDRRATSALIEERAGRPNRVTLGADKAYDAEDFADELRSMNVTPHGAHNIARRRSAIDGRTTPHPGCGVSQRIRKRIEKGFGWVQEIGLLRRIRVRGRERVDRAFAFSAAACNLTRLPGLQAEPAVAGKEAVKGTLPLRPSRRRPATATDRAQNQPCHRTGRSTADRTARSQRVRSKRKPSSAACEQAHIL